MLKFKQTFHRRQFSRKTFSYLMYFLIIFLYGNTIIPLNNIKSFNTKSLMTDAWLFIVLVIYICHILFMITTHNNCITNCIPMMSIQNYSLMPRVLLVNRRNRSLYYQKLSAFFISGKNNLLIFEILIALVILVRFLMVV